MCAGGCLGCLLFGNQPGDIRLRLCPLSAVNSLSPHASFCPLCPDCGLNANTTQIVVNVKADFTGHPTISPRVLMTNAVWNLCLDDTTRRQRGEADLCW